jgi:hypothetical protein
METDMPILKHRNKSGFTQINNETLQTRDIGFASKGILAELLSRPNDWQINKTSFEMPQFGRTSVNNCFKELRNAGYLYVETIRDESGKIIDNVWHCSDVPYKETEWQLYLNSEKPELSETGLRSDRISVKQQQQIKSINTKKERSTNTEDCAEELFVLEVTKKINYSFKEFWDLYDKKVGLLKKIEKKWNGLSNKERELAMSHIPKYKESEPEKRYRKNPETYINQKSWNDEIIYRNGNGSGGFNNKDKILNYMPKQFIPPSQRKAENEKR